MLTLSIPSMSCGHCKGAISKTIAAVDSLAQVQFHMSSKTVSVETVAAPEQVLNCLEIAGYPATILATT